MAQITIVYWRDIPAQVVVKQGRNSAKRVLSERFEKAIDRAAMRAGARGTDDYLAEWRRGEPEPCSEDIDAEAMAVASRLEREYDDERLAVLVATGGREAG